MVRISTGTFRFVLQTPRGTLIDCRAGSLIFPAHDGHQGVLRDHAPMLCRLGLGIIQIKEMPDRPDAFFLVNGGFTRISDNFMKVLSLDVTTFEGLNDQQAKDMLSDAKSKVAGAAYFSTQSGEAIDSLKAKLVVKMAEMAKIDIGTGEKKRS